MVQSSASPTSTLGPNYDATPHIGTVFEHIQLSSILNDDEKIKELAHLVSHRGVVFFTEAQDLTLDQQKVLGQKMGELTGKPATSTLHRHPISEETSELGSETSVISSKGGIARQGYVFNRIASSGWHTDITFEPVPSDYAILKMHTLPSVGGDTLWASGYEAYDRLSPAYKKFLEGLTALHDGSGFTRMAQQNGQKILSPRGSPENKGEVLQAVHPVIRTHPVTGYKVLFINRGFTKQILELTPDESDNTLEYLWRHISENHDLQVRFRWTPNAIAIWDNRATYHTATNDYGDELREGNRVVGIGEKPYFDPQSKSRREMLGLPVI